jgi:hypothetical protein
MTRRSQMEGRSRRSPRRPAPRNDASAVSRGVCAAGPQQHRQAFRRPRPRIELRPGRVCACRPKRRYASVASRHGDHDHDEQTGDVLQSSVFVIVATCRRAKAQRERDPQRDGGQGVAHVRMMSANNATEPLMISTISCRPAVTANPTGLILTARIAARNRLDVGAVAVLRSINASWRADLGLRHCRLHGSNRSCSHWPGNDSAVATHWLSRSAAFVGHKYRKQGAYVDTTLGRCQVGK